MHEKGLLGRGRGGRGHTSALRAPDGDGDSIFFDFGITSAPTSASAARPRPRRAARRLLSPQPVPGVTRSQARGPHLGETPPHTHAPQHTHTHTRGPGSGTPEYKETGGWLGVISAGRARLSKRGGRGEEESERGGVKKRRVLGRRETGRGDGPTVCLSVCLPALGAPAVRPPPQSEIHTKWRRGLDRLRG